MPTPWLTNFVVITVVMVLQVLIGIYGFYAIRTFEKYTVPVTVVIMVLMSVLAWTPAGRRQLGPHQLAAAAARTSRC